MNKRDAKIISKTITNEQLELMLENAKVDINDWTKVSNNNKGMTKGSVWNILCKDFNVDHEYIDIVKYNMIREFGDYLPTELKIKKEENKGKIKPFHQEPLFD